MRSDLAHASGVARIPAFAGRFPCFAEKIPCLGGEGICDFALCRRE